MACALRFDLLNEQTGTESGTHKFDQDPPPFRDKQGGWHYLRIPLLNHKHHDSSTSFKGLERYLRIRSGAITLLYFGAQKNLIPCNKTRSDMEQGVGAIAFPSLASSLDDIHGDYCDILSQVRSPFRYPKSFVPLRPNFFHPPLVIISFSHKDNHKGKNVIWSGAKKKGNEKTFAKKVAQNREMHTRPIFVSLNTQGSRLRSREAKDQYLPARSRVYSGQNTTTEERFLFHFGRIRADRGNASRLDKSPIGHVITKRAFSG